MLSTFKYHSKLLLIGLLIVLAGCQLKTVNRTHGILYLENRIKQLNVDQDNFNDVIQQIGEPQIKSIDNENIWIYIERVLTRGKYHKLGLPILKSNNVAILEFDKYGILKQAKLYKKEQINKLKFDDKVTENMLTQKSFVEKFLSSIKQKMYGNK